MIFRKFLEITCYTPIYAARKILYAPNSRPAKMAKNLGFEITPSVRSGLVWVASGSLSIDQAEEKIKDTPNNKCDKNMQAPKQSESRPTLVNNKKVDKCESLPHAA